jgi:hypothetical protein
MVICPPGLVGDSHYGTGWQWILKILNYMIWEESRGKIEVLADTIQSRGIGSTDY